MYVVHMRKPWWCKWVIIDSQLPGTPLYWHPVWLIVVYWWVCWCPCVGSASCAAYYLFSSQLLHSHWSHLHHLHHLTSCIFILLVQKNSRVKQRLPQILQKGNGRWGGLSDGGKPFICPSEKGRDVLFTIRMGESIFSTLLVCGQTFTTDIYYALGRTSSDKEHMCLYVQCASPHHHGLHCKWHWGYNIMQLHHLTSKGTGCFSAFTMCSVMMR